MVLWCELGNMSAAPIVVVEISLFCLSRVGRGLVFRKGVRMLLADGYRWQTTC